ncbi:MAG: hypothetical protein WC045_04010 [Patescibacteria group bacterium]
MNQVVKSPQYHMLITSYLAGYNSHAYLFHGPDTQTQYAVAYAYAHFLSCTDKKEGEVCGTCPACRAAIEGQILYSEIIGEDPNESIKIEAIHEIQRFLSLKQAEGSFKIVIIRNSQQIAREAREVLLKTLEEPSPGSVIFLLTTDRNALTKTILSRCQSLYFPVYPVIGIVDEEEAFWRAVYRDNEALVKEVMSITAKKREGKKDILLSRLASLVSNDEYRLMLVAYDLSTGDDAVEEIRQLIGVLGMLWQGSLLKKPVSGVFKTLQLEEKNIYDIIPRVITVLIETQQKLVSTAGNQRLILESGMLQVSGTVR